MGCKVLTIPVYGHIELQNGLVLNWLRFIPVKHLSDSLIVAQREAIKIVEGEHGIATKRCWVD